MKIVMEEQKEYSTLPADSIVHLKIEELSIREYDGRSGKFEKLEFKFKILGVQATGDGSPVGQYDDVIGSPIWGSVPFKLTESPENKLRMWAEAILGIEMGVGYELDVDLFVGRECRGLTRQFDKRITDPQTGQPRKGHGIDSLLPKAGGAAPQQQGYAWGQPQQPSQQGYQQQGYQQQGGYQQPPQQPPAQQQYQQPPAQQQQPQQQQLQPVAQQDPWAGQNWDDEPPF